MLRPITYAPRGRRSMSRTRRSASCSGSSMCQWCRSIPRRPRGWSRLWSGPATYPSSETDMWHVVVVMLVGRRVGPELIAPRPVQARRPPHGNPDTSLERRDGLCRAESLAQTLLDDSRDHVQAQTSALDLLDG